MQHGYVETSAGLIPAERYQQWQALATATAAKTGSGNLAHGLMLHQQIQQHFQQQAREQPPAMHMQPGGTALPLTANPAWSKTGGANGLLHDLLSEAVKTSLSAKPKVERKATGPLASTAAGSKAQADEKGAITTPEGASATWATPAGPAGLQTQEDDALGDSAGDGGWDVVGEGEADGDHDGVVDEVDMLFGQVLTLQERLSNLDSENSQLKRQLDQQRALMQQMEQALMDQGSGGGGAKEEAAAAAPEKHPHLHLQQQPGVQAGQAQGQGQHQVQATQQQQQQQVQAPTQPTPHLPQASPARDRSSSPSGSPTGASAIAAFGAAAFGAGAAASAASPAAAVPPARSALAASAQSAYPVVGPAAGASAGPTTSTTAAAPSARVPTASAAPAPTPSATPALAQTHSWPHHPQHSQPAHPGYYPQSSFAHQGSYSHHAAPTTQGAYAATATPYAWTPANSYGHGTSATTVTISYPPASTAAYPHAATATYPPAAYAAYPYAQQHTGVAYAAQHTGAAYAPQHTGAVYAPQHTGAAYTQGYYGSPQQPHVAASAGRPPQASPLAQQQHWNASPPAQGTPPRPASTPQRAAPPSTPAQPWSCQACTYEHTGKEALYLRCAICNALR